MCKTCIKTFIKYSIHKYWKEGVKALIVMVLIQKEKGKTGPHSKSICLFIFGI